MNELNLFTGSGGGVYASHLLGWNTVGYVEWDKFCQQVIAARIADGTFAAAPIFGDVREFVQSGAAREYRGFADVVTGGFPCQDISVAGSGSGLGGDRSGMWFAMRDVIRDVRPRFVVVENSPTLAARGLGIVLGNLAELGFDARWGVFRACAIGAPHMRARMLILAHARRNGWQAWPGVKGASPGERPRSDRPAIENEIRRDDPRHSWWDAEPGMVRVVDGLADRINRTKALGNGQIPRVVSDAWRVLSGGGDV